MARILIRQAHGGATRIISDGALPYFLNQGYVVLETLDDDTDASPLYLSAAEGDLRWAKISDLGDPESAEVAVISEAVADSEALRAAYGAAVPVTRYGAVGDGTADDTAALTAAFAAGSVVLPPGLTFAINAPLAPPSGTRIYGHGATIVARNATGSLDSAGWHLNLTGDDITIDGVTFTVPATAITGGSAEEAVVHITGARNRVTNCRFTNTGIDSAVFVKGTTALDNLIADNDIDGSRIIYSYAGASRTTCRGNRVANAPGRGLSGVGNDGGGAWNEDCIVADNTVLDAANMGIEDGGLTRGTIIRNNRIIAPAAMGISAVGVLALLDGNTVIDAGEDGIEISSSGMKVANNQIIAPNGSTHAGISINNYNSAAAHRGATIVGNHITGWQSCVKAIPSSYFAISIVGNVLQDWSLAGVAIGSLGSGGVIAGNTFLQTQPRPAGTTRFGVSLEAAFTVTGNRFIYTASSAGAVDGYDTAIRPAPGSDSSQIIGNLVDGGGIVAPSPQVAVIATNGADPANVLIMGNSATNSAYFDFNFLNSPVAFGNSGQQNNTYTLKWSAYGAAPAPKPTITGSRGGNAALASVLTQLATLGLITDSTTA